MSAWLALLGAGLLEVAWALGLKYSDGFTRLWPSALTLIAIGLSFTLNRKPRPEPGLSCVA